jgi:hypothetical protein
MNFTRLVKLAPLAVLPAVWLLLMQGSGPRAATAPAYTVRPEHPRIWLTPAILARLRAQAANNSPRWQVLKAACDQDLASPPAGDLSLINHALAYQVTGNPAYADRVIAIMQRFVARGMPAITRDSGYDCRITLPAMAVGYDWCYDRMTSEQRTAFREQMEQWADWVWPETNPERASGWAVRAPGDNYFHGFMMTWMVGLALYGDSPKAPGYIDVARQKWNEKVRPYLEQYGEGGYPLEGTTYGIGSASRIMWYLAAHSTATDEELLNSPGFNWPREFIKARLHLTAPTLDRTYPGGDQPRDSQAKLSDYDRSAALVALAHLDPATGGYAKWWLDHITPARNRWRFTQWEEFLWYRDDRQALDYTRQLPLGYYARGAGWMTSRSDWRPQATQVVMIAGPTRASHQDRAQNGFMIFRGDWLAAAAKLRSHSGLRPDAASNNSITVGDLAQTLSQDAAHVLHFADTDQYAYFAGEAGGAYEGQKGKSTTPALSEFRRELLFLKPDHVIVFDHVSAPDATLPKQWHLNTLTEPLIGSDTYQATVGTSTLYGKTLLPRGAAITKQPLYLGAEKALSSWRVDIAASTGETLTPFLNVLEATDASHLTPTPAQPIRTTPETAAGVQVGEQIALFDASPTAKAPLTYELTDTPAAEHFVLNQPPGQWFEVTAQNATGAPLQRHRVQATDQGVLLFSFTSPGIRKVVIRPSEGSRQGQT